MAHGCVPRSIFEMRIYRISFRYKSEIVEIDFASRVPPRQPEAQFLIQDLIFDDFENFEFL